MTDVKRAYARLGAEKILMGTEWPDRTSTSSG